MNELTRRQLEFLRFIDRHVADRGYAPSIREMMAALGVNSTNGVTDHLEALERKGVLARAKKTSRAIAVTPHGRQTLARAEDQLDGPEASSVGTEVRRLAGVSVEYAPEPSGPRWRVNGGPWWRLGRDVGWSELEASLGILRRLGVVS